MSGTRPIRFVRSSRFDPRDLPYMRRGYLYADLDNVARIVDRVVQTLDRKVGWWIRRVVD
jgi:hypothetical protein